jgi:pimeloyl-ACP methyl ester carboxylesterase
MIGSMVRESRITVSGRPVRYLEAGSGWPVVLIHAFPLNADMWRPQLERVPDGWRFIAPDMRGFGPDAAGNPGAISLDDMAGDVATLLDQLVIDTAVIGGLSMGGYITFALFKRAPERFTGMILADTRAQADTPEGLEGRRKTIAVARAEGPAGVASSLLPKLLGKTSSARRPEVTTTVRAMMERSTTEGIVAAVEAMMDRPDRTSELPGISCPTLVIVGEEDVVTPVADAVAMQNQIARSRLVILPEAGHLSNLEVPDGFTLALGDFLSSNL